MSFTLPDHEALAELAKENPEALEALRRDWVEQLIDHAPQHIQRRLRGLQFQIDCQRRLHTNPLASCVEISRMMYDSVHRLNRALHGEADSESEPLARNATVLAFPGA